MPDWPDACDEAPANAAEGVSDADEGVSDAAEGVSDAVEGVSDAVPADAVEEWAKKNHIQADTSTCH